MHRYGQRWTRFSASYGRTLRCGASSAHSSTTTNSGFRMLGHGSLTSLTNVIGGLMARVDELSGDGFDAAAGELHALLESPGGGHANAVTGGLVTGYHVVLFHGLCLEAEIEIGGGLSMLPFERARAFVDEEVLKDLAPDVVRFRDWRLVGAVVRPFQVAAGAPPTGRFPGHGKQNRPDLSPGTRWSF